MKGIFGACLRYIHMNPVKAKICNNIMQYEHSSMREYTGKRKNREVLCEKALSYMRKNLKMGHQLELFIRKRMKMCF